MDVGVPEEREADLYVRDRQRALAALKRVRDVAFEILPVNEAVLRLVPSERERGELVGAIADLYARRRARRRRSAAARTTGA